MAVNTNVWLNPVSAWRNVAETTTKSVRQMQIDGDWGTPPFTKLWDSSITFCGMDKTAGCYIANAAVVFANEPEPVPLYTDNAITNWNFGNSLEESGGGNMGFNTSLSNNGNRFTDWLPNYLTNFDYPYNAVNTFRAVFSLKINKMLARIYLYVAQTDGESTSTDHYWLDEYLNNTSIMARYPYIRFVGFVLMADTSTNNTPSWIAISTGYCHTVSVNAFYSDDFQNALITESNPNPVETRTTSEMMRYAGIYINNRRDVIPLMGCWYSAVSESFFPYRPIIFDSDLTHYKTTGDFGVNLSKIWYARRFDNTVLDDIRKQMAFYGLFFVGGAGWSTTTPLTDPCIYCGTIDSDGVTHGDYTHGIDNADQPQFAWTDSNDSTYDPSNPPIPDRNSDPVTFNPVSLADGGLKRYVLDDNAMSAFGVDLYRVIDTSNPDELIQNQTLTNFLTNNPLDAVVSVKRFPLPDMSQGTITNIMLGKVQMQTAAKPFTSTSTILSCGAINIPAKFGNFLDYETQYELILPFCGAISLDPKIVTGKNVEVKYTIDYTTGTCTAWILTVTSDGVETVIDSANGNCTIDIPLSGVQTATLTGEIYNANENLKTAKFNAVVNAVSGVGDFAKDVKSRDVAGGAKTVANAVNSIHDIKKAEWNINNTQIPFKMIGASSGCNSFQIELIPRLNVYYPIVDSTYNAADYRHNVGAAVCDTTTIGDYGGYAEITNVDLSGFVATAEEKNMIVNALMGGVYL